MKYHDGFSGQDIDVSIPSEPNIGRLFPMTDSKVEQQGQGWHWFPKMGMYRRLSADAIETRDPGEIARMLTAALWENADLKRQLQIVSKALAELYWTVAAGDGIPLGIAPAQRHLDKARATLDATKSQP